MWSMRGTLKGVDEHGKWTTRLHGKQMRTFGYVGDVVECLAALAWCESALGQIVNVGGRAKTRIRDLAEIVKMLCVSESEIRMVPYEEAYGLNFIDMRWRVPLLCKMCDLTGVQPTTSLETMLAKVIEYEQERV